MTTFNLPKVSKEELLAAIRGGVEDAMWRMIRHGTDMPCQDFFDAVKDGVIEGIGTFAIDNPDVFRSRERDTP